MNHIILSAKVGDRGINFKPGDVNASDFRSVDWIALRVEETTESGKPQWHNLQGYGRTAAAANALNLQEGEPIHVAGSVASGKDGKKFIKIHRILRAEGMQTHRSVEPSQPADRGAVDFTDDDVF